LICCSRLIIGEGFSDHTFIGLRRWYRGEFVKITRVESFVLHVPVTRGGLADSTHQLTHWGVPGAVIHTDDGLVGCGYTGTHAYLSSDRLIADCIAEVYGPLLMGEDPGAVRHLWSRLLHYPPVQWVGRAGITHLALSAIDIALWDLKARDAGVPLFRLLGGTAEKRIEAYNTDGGWLNWTAEQLVADSCALTTQGYRGVKIKVGRPDVSEDIARLLAVRGAIGPAVQLMVDANGRWDLPHALDFARRAAPLNLNGWRSRCGTATWRGTGSSRYAAASRLLWASNSTRSIISRSSSRTGRWISCSPTQ
jgi:L-alanine-DL-glutamate epimerase-like enolase superfamily enzyme